MFRKPLIYLTLTILFFTGCEAGSPVFNGNEAYKHLVRQCNFGPRNPGSEGHANCMKYLIEELKMTADTVWTQPFTEIDPKTGKEYALANIIAQYNTTSTKGHLLFGAHWDTRPWSDMDNNFSLRNDPVIGANDGASGVALLLELGKILKAQSPDKKVTIVLFDGEDLGESGYPESYAKGSQFFAQNLPIEKPEEAIVVDMIGDAELQIPIERFSYQIHPTLVRDLWTAAAKLNLTAFSNTLGPQVYDDHIPLWEYAQIPAIDLIDFNYPNPYKNYWHTSQDTPDKCSPASLEQVGRLLVHYIYVLKSGD